MNKAELIEEVASATGDSKARAGEFVEATFKALETALARRDKVTIPGFGSFLARDRAARTGRNPQTGAAVKIKATTVPAFKPGSELKQAVASGKSGKPKTGSSKSSGGSKSSAKKSAGKAKSTAKKSTAKAGGAKKSTAKKSTAKSKRR